MHFLVILFFLSIWATPGVSIEINGTRFVTYSNTKEDYFWESDKPQLQLTPAVAYIRSGSELVFNCTFPFQKPSKELLNIVQFKFRHEPLENATISIVNSQVVQLKITSATKANQGGYKCDSKDYSLRGSSSSHVISYEDEIDLKKNAINDFYCTYQFNESLHFRVFAYYLATDVLYSIVAYDSTNKSYYWDETIQNDDYGIEVGFQFGIEFIWKAKYTLQLFHLETYRFTLTYIINQQTFTTEYSFNWRAIVLLSDFFQSPTLLYNDQQQLLLWNYSEKGHFYDSYFAYSDCKIQLFEFNFFENWLKPMQLKYVFNSMQKMDDLFSPMKPSEFRVKFKNTSGFIIQIKYTEKNVTVADLKDLTKYRAAITCRQFERVNSPERWIKESHLTFERGLHSPLHLFVTIVDEEPYPTVSWNFPKGLKVSSIEITIREKGKKKLDYFFWNYLKFFNISQFTPKFNWKLKTVRLPANVNYSFTLLICSQDNICGNETIYFETTRRISRNEPIIVTEQNYQTLFKPEGELKYPIESQGIIQEDIENSPSMWNFSYTAVPMRSNVSTERTTKCISDEGKQKYRLEILESEMNYDFELSGSPWSWMTFSMCPFIAQIDSANIQLTTVLIIAFLVAVLLVIVALIWIFIRKAQLTKRRLNEFQITVQCNDDNFSVDASLKSSDYVSNKHLNVEKSSHEINEIIDSFISYPVNSVANQYVTLPKTEPPASPYIALPILATNPNCNTFCKTPEIPLNENHLKETFPCKETDDFEADIHRLFEETQFQPQIVQNSYIKLPDVMHKPQ